MERREAERLREEGRQAAESSVRARAVTDMKSRIERALSKPDSAADEPLMDDVFDNGGEPALGTVLAHTQAAEAAEHAPAVKLPEQPRSADDSADPADIASRVPAVGEFDIAEEVARLLKNRRWEKRKEPFKGFDSPPGRF